MNHQILITLVVFLKFFDQEKLDGNKEDGTSIMVDKASSIRNDPNDWSDDARYIVDLLKRIVRVSLETIKIVNALPPLNEAK